METENYQGRIKDFKYLKRDNLFLLDLEDGENIIIDSEGNIHNREELTSRYLDEEHSSGYTGICKLETREIYDVFGNSAQDEFISDYDHEAILGVCQMDDQDVVLILEKNDTPKSSQTIIKIYDENANFLREVKSTDSIFKKKGIEEYFKNICGFHYSGDDICSIVYKMANIEGLFGINVKTGEIVEPDVKFSDGYGIVDRINDKRIVDVHGKTIKDSLDRNYGELSNYHNGFFFSRTTKKFYYINLNVKIDLSEYNVSLWSNDDKESYVFNDGYCGIEVRNDNDTKFFGVINDKGKWIIELTDTLTSRPIVEKINDKMLELGGNQIYNMETKEYREIPYEVTRNRPVLINGQYYFLNEQKEFCLYNPNNNEIQSLKIVG